MEARISFIFGILFFSSVFTCLPVIAKYVPGWNPFKAWVLARECLPSSFGKYKLLRRVLCLDYFFVIPASMTIDLGLQAT